MILNIDDNEMISDLQDRFNVCFPFLKIEFYDTRHKWQTASSEEHKISADRKVGDIRRNHNSGIFDIKSWYKTGQVEQEFRNVFGLHAQIFFIKNGQWIQSSAADDLTLAYLDEMGERDITKFTAKNKK
jgi:hypothetical protein